jgi:H+/gluconate symporter-like permease
MKLSEMFQFNILIWIQILIAMAVVVVFIIKARDLFFKKNLEGKKLRSGIHTVLFMGSFAGVFGFLIQIVGIVQALAAIIEAADISPQILWEGAKRSFYNPIFGLLTFLVSGVLWFILQARYKNLVSKD